MRFKSTLLMSGLLLSGAVANAQYHVSTGTTKYVLLEEATGTWCGYCPDGAQIIEQDITCSSCSTEPYTNVISWHGPAASPYFEPLAVTGDPFNTAAPYDSLGFPSGVIDRAGGTNSWGTAGMSMDRGAWQTNITNRAGTSANFQVDVYGQYNPSTRVLTVTVYGKALSALTGTWNINAFLEEDSISSATYPQHSYMYSGPTSSWFYNLCASICPGYSDCASCAIIPSANYAHMDVARAILSTSNSLWGDAAFTNPASGTTVGKTYTYTVPAAYNPTYLKVIGLVEKSGGNVYTRPIENSIVSRVRLMPSSGLEVAEVKTMQNVELFPNPASNAITVKGTLDNPTDTRVVVYNSIGQVVSDNNYKANGSMFYETISLDKLSSGIYFMHIINNGERITKKFTIEK